ncbi:MAG: PD-(D/E)XK nuclease family transposase [Eubacterium sp.]|nr:PD-(D/E)XK nuclease family transposase [Eubacterium sp.]
MEKNAILETDKNANRQQYDVRVNRIIDDLTLFDDDLMSLVFDKNILATQLVLRIILKRNIRVISVEGQEELKNPLVGGRDITLDIHAIDTNGEEIDIEVQSGSEGAHVKRARFHSAMIDSRMLRERDNFKNLKDSYVIFIYKHDKFRKGYPVYRADRTVIETGESFNDGSHIIYVNGNYQGSDDIGHLIRDFHTKSPEDMYFKELADSVHHFKETEKGRDSMSEAVRKFAEEYAEQYRIDALAQSVKMLMQNTSVTMDQAFSNLGISDSDQILIKNQVQENANK